MIDNQRTTAPARRIKNYPNITVRGARAIDYAMSTGCQLWALNPQFGWLRCGLSVAKRMKAFDAHSPALATYGVADVSPKPK